MPRISVIIPTFDRAHMVSDAIASALSQPVPDIEVIVVDDGSTDNTRELVGRFRDERLRYVFQPNGGKASAFNKGLASASGELIAGLDSDDLYLPGGLLPLLRGMEEWPGAGVVVGGYRTVDKGTGRVSETRPWRLYPRLDLNTWLLPCPVLLPAALIRRAWIERIGGFDEHLRSVVDWDLGLRLAATGCQMVWVEELIFVYRLHRGNMVRQTDERMSNILAILDRFYSGPGVPPEIVAKRPQIYAAWHLIGAGREYAHGQVQPAMRNVAKAVELDQTLLADCGARLSGSLLAWAWNLEVGDPIAYMERVFGNLPAMARVIRCRRADALAECAAGVLFEAYGRRDWATIRRRAFPLLVRSPRLLRNRGLISICLEAWLGSRLMGWVRKAYWCVALHAKRLGGGSRQSGSMT